MKLFLFTLLLTHAGYGLWDYAIKPALFDDSPRALTLSNSEGRELEVTLLRQDATHVHFQRTADPTLYRYPIDQLSYFVSGNSSPTYPHGLLLAMMPGCNSINQK